MKTAYVAQAYHSMMALAWVREISKKYTQEIDNTMYYFLSVSISLTLDSVFEDKSYLNYRIILYK